LQAVIVPGGGLFDQGQFVPGYGREVMVFIVIAHVEGNDIQYAIIAKGFLFFVMGKVMFLDPAGGRGGLHPGG